MKPANLLRVLVEKYSLYYPTLEPSSRITMFISCKNVPPAIAGVCRQLSNAYLNSSNVNVLLAGRTVIVSRLATLVLVYVVPGPNKQRAFDPSILLS